MSIKTSTIAVLAALVLSGCSASTYAGIDAFDKGVLEPRTDANYDGALKRWCRLPIDIHLRAIARQTITARSLTDNCVEWRGLRNLLIGETMTRLGLADE